MTKKEAFKKLLNGATIRHENSELCYRLHIERDKIINICGHTYDLNEWQNRYKAKVYSKGWEVLPETW